MYPPERAPRVAPIPARITGPAIDQLETRLASPAASAPQTRSAITRQFWRETAGRTPLFERVPPGPDAPAGSAPVNLVTFLWRGAQERGVFVFANGLSDRVDLSASELRRVADTDVWHLSYVIQPGWRGSYGFVLHGAEARPPWHPTPGEAPPSLRDQRDRALPDPRCPLTVQTRRGNALSLAEHPDAPAPAWRAAAAGTSAAAGQTPTERTAMPAALIETVGPGGRRCWVFDSATPESRAAAGAGSDTAGDTSAAGDTGSAGDTGALWFVLDGEVWAQQFGLGEILRAEYRANPGLPRVRAVLIDSISEARRWQDLGASSAFVTELAERWLPWARNRFGTDFPRRSCGVAGQSLGGLTALRCGTEHPHAFGLVAAQSASLWVHAPAVAPFAPLPAPRIHVEVGTHEARLLEPNRAFAATLSALGADVTLHEHEGGHDYACWLSTLPELLVSLSR